MICKACGEENPERFRLCGICGAELPKAAAGEIRKVVTLVFADVSGSTALGERLDAEAVRWVMSRFFDTARDVLEHHGGTVEKFIGDAVMAAFGIPVVREDDALRGVRAAVALRDRLRDFGREVESRYGTEIGVRIGVNTGEVVAGDAAAGQAFASGDAVNVAARLEQAAAPGEVLLGEATLALVRDAVTVEACEPLTLKGKSRRVACWRLVEVAARAAGVARRLDAPLVGRETELAQLLDEWRRTVEEQDTRVVTVVAPAGTGKTRLLAELRSSVEPGTQVLVGRCLAYGEGITFWPIAEAVRVAAGIADEDSADVAVARLARLLAGETGATEIIERLAPVLSPAATKVALEETFWAVRKLLEALARRRPLVVILDDVHWAEESLLDLTEYLAGWTRGVPLLLVCGARPELLERRPSVASPRANSRTLLLEPLATRAAEELMAWQLEGAPLPADLSRNILAVSEGNPLFVQELVRMLIDDGAIVRRNGTWLASGNVGRLAMPPTIQALLAARLDQLESPDRDVAQRAAVVGQVFSWGSVRELCDEPARSELAGRLHVLVRKQLIVPEAGTPASEDSFRFGHVLIRDAAYEGLAKRSRAELHERFATWLEREQGAHLTGLEEIIGYHLEQAAAYRLDLGDGADAAALATRASARLIAGGRRALESGDLAAAANLLGRGAATLPVGDALRLAIRLESIPALVEAGQFEHADASIDEILAASTDQLLITAARAWRAFLAAQRASGTFEECQAAAEIWRVASEGAGDHSGQATALGFLAKMEFWAEHAATAEALWLRAAEQAELAGDAREEAESLVWLLIAGMFGPTPVGVALERCATIASRAGASRKVRLMCSIERGVLEAMNGDTDSGRERVGRGRQQLDELGLAWLATVMAQEATIVEQLAGDPHAAERLLRPSVEKFEQMGESGFLFTHTLLLANALQEQGRFDEAARLVERLGVAEEYRDDSAFAHYQARQAAHEGRISDALGLARRSVEQAAATDFLREHGDRLVGLADIHALAGQRGDALAALAEAEALYARKGCLAAIRQTAKRRAGLEIA